MNRRTSTILTLAVVIILAMVWNTPAAASHKVDICHRTNGTNPYVQIEIATSALLAHLAHPWGPDVYPVPAAGCSSLNVTPTPTEVPPTPTATLVPTLVPTATPTYTETPLPTATDTQEPTPTETQEPTCEELENCEVGDPTPTSEPTSEPTQPAIVTTSGECQERVVGYLFHLTGPNGELADFASFSPRPEGGYYLPNAQSQEACLGWVAVNANGGIEITVNCNGKSNVTLIRCEGGGCSAVYED